MKTINGQLLKQMLISGGNNLYNHYPEVDALNVFPVPDGDTGMNMNLTMTVVLRKFKIEVMLMPMKSRRHSLVVY